MRLHTPFQTSRRALELAVQARALRSIAGGVAVEPGLVRTLEKAGLVAKVRAKWALTVQGHIALAFAAARF